LSVPVDLSSRLPIVECFIRGEVPLDVRMSAIRGTLALPFRDHVEVLTLLASDADPAVAAGAEAALQRLSPDALSELLAGPEASEAVRGFFAARAAAPVPELPADAVRLLGEPGEPQASPDAAAAGGADPERRGAAQRLAMLSVAERMKVAMQGSREERAILVRDPNRLVSSAVLSSPKLTESEVEAIARMANVSDEVLRVLGTNRAWTKNYSVIAALTRNAKTPVSISLTLVNRLSERDVKMLSIDRNIPEPVRLSARKLCANRQSRRQ
jgi:hypothetical protein